MIRPRTAATRSGTLGTAARLLALIAILLGVQAGPSSAAHAAPAFKVIAFYDGTCDPAHISFVHEANVWFPQQAAQYGFSYTATNDWSQLNTANLANYQVVMFLDDYPQTASQRSAFQAYMQSGGGWIGFHVSAYNDAAPSDWSWYHETFLGTGTFQTTPGVPRPRRSGSRIRTTRRRPHCPRPSPPRSASGTAGRTTCGRTRTSTSWPRWTPSTFPIGTDPNQTWYSGYYPIVWSNRNYRMVYNNFGHNAMDYSTNTTLSSTFASAQQNQLLIQEIRWAAGQSGPVTPPPGDRHRADPRLRRQVRGRRRREQRQRHGSAALRLQRHRRADLDGRRPTAAAGARQVHGRHRGRRRRTAPRSSCTTATARAPSSGRRAAATLVNTGSGKCLDATGSLGQRHPAADLDVRGCRQPALDAARLRGARPPGPAGPRYAGRRLLRPAGLRRRATTVSACPRCSGGCDGGRAGRRRTGSGAEGSPVHRGRPGLEHTVHREVDPLVVEAHQPGDGQQLAGREVVRPRDVAVRAAAVRPTSSRSWCPCTGRR